MRQYAGIPLVLTAWVVVVSASLIGIVLLGLYTHDNLAQAPRPTYARTEQILIGRALPYQGPGLSEPLPSSQDLVARGRELLVADGCASCHGLEGRGGPVGKPIVGFSAAELRAKTTKGPGGMPAFDKRGLSDEDLAAMAAYLASLKK